MDQKADLKINLGCGRDYRDGYFNIDANTRLRADGHYDLETLPELFSANSAEEILAFDVLEHIRNLPALMAWCCRVLKPGGKMYIKVPYDLSLSAWQDPTHVRAMNENSFIYYAEWSWYLGWEKYALKRVRVSGRRYGDDIFDVRLFPRTDGSAISHDRHPHAINIHYMEVELVKTPVDKELSRCGY